MNQNKMVQDGRRLMVRFGDMLLQLKDRLYKTETKILSEHEQPESSGDEESISQDDLLPTIRSAGSQGFHSTSENENASPSKIFAPKLSSSAITTPKKTGTGGPVPYGLPSPPSSADQDTTYRYQLRRSESPSAERLATRSIQQPYLKSYDTGSPKSQSDDESGVTNHTSFLEKDDEVKEPSASCLSSHSISSIASTPPRLVDVQKAPSRPSSQDRSEQLRLERRRRRRSPSPVFSVFQPSKRAKHRNVSRGDAGRNLNSVSPSRSRLNEDLISQSTGISVSQQVQKPREILTYGGTSRDPRAASPGPSARREQTLNTDYSVRDNGEDSAVPITTAVTSASAFRKNTVGTGVDSNIEHVRRSLRPSTVRQRLTNAPASPSQRSFRLTHAQTNELVLEYCLRSIRKLKYVRCYKYIPLSQMLSGASHDSSHPSTNTSASNSASGPDCFWNYVKTYLRVKNEDDLLQKFDITTVTGKQNPGPRFASKSTTHPRQIDRNVENESKLKPRTQISWTTRSGRPKSLPAAPATALFVSRMQNLLRAYGNFGPCEHCRAAEELRRADRGVDTTTGVDADADGVVGVDEGDTDEGDTDEGDTDEGDTDEGDTDEGEGTKGSDKKKIEGERKRERKGCRTTKTTEQLKRKKEIAQFCHRVWIADSFHDHLDDLDDFLGACRNAKDQNVRLENLNERFS